MKKDMRAEPVRRMVVMGESNAYGMNASDPRNEWVQVVANLIRDFQDEPVRVFNNSIPSNVISPRSRGYAHVGDAGRPSALERYREDMIALKPDLAIYAYGLNDSRSNQPRDEFLEDYGVIVADTRRETDALIVLAGPYWNPQYDPALWNQLPERPDGPFWDVGRALVVSYVEGIRQLADRHGCLFVDLFTPLEGCLWLIAADRCHYTDIGQRVLGMMVFNAIAANCSFVGRKSDRILREGRFGVPSTGGTQAMPEVLRAWRKDR